MASRRKVVIVLSESGTSCLGEALFVRNVLSHSCDVVFVGAKQSVSVSGNISLVVDHVFQELVGSRVDALFIPSGVSVHRDKALRDWTAKILTQLNNEDTTIAASMNGVRLLLAAGKKHKLLGNLLKGRTVLVKDSQSVKLAKKLGAVVGDSTSATYIRDGRVLTTQAPRAPCDMLRELVGMDKMPALKSQLSSTWFDDTLAVPKEIQSAKEKEPHWTDVIRARLGLVEKPLVAVVIPDRIDDGMLANALQFWSTYSPKTKVIALSFQARSRVLRTSSGVRFLVSRTFEDFVKFPIGIASLRHLVIPSDASIKTKDVVATMGNDTTMVRRSKELIVDLH